MNQRLACAFVLVAIATASAFPTHSGHDAGLQSKHQGRHDLSEPVKIVPVAILTDQAEGKFSIPIVVKSASDQKSHFPHQF